MHSSTLALLPLFIGFLASEVRATQCNATTTCLSANPCCSEFGFCGVEHFCLGGCNPLSSNTLDSCRPKPLCQDAVHLFTDNSRILTNATFFDGNVTEYDWVVDKGNIMNTNATGGELALLLTETNGGTRISSTQYVHYGTITAKIKTGRWKGVVIAFITMSDTKDEIDWEFPGANTTAGQSNFFWQGVIPNPTRGDTHSISTDTFSNYHDFTIDWQPDTLSWAVDGNVVRTIKASDFTENAVVKYPNTPSRVQFSIWPAGTDDYPAGTVEWAGGEIDWTDPDYVAAGQFYTLIKSVEVKCADPQKPGPNITGYVYTSNSSGNPSVAFTNASTLINGADSLKSVSVQFPLGLLATLFLALSVL